MLGVAARVFRRDPYHASVAHATKTKKSAAERRSAAIERTSGMFAHLAPGVSLADELIADRRAEVRAEEHADAAAHRGGGVEASPRTL